jgi:hypothetical protein
MVRTRKGYDPSMLKWKHLFAIKNRELQSFKVRLLMIDKQKPKEVTFRSPDMSRYKRSRSSFYEPTYGLIYTAPYWVHWGTKYE